MGAGIQRSKMHQNKATFLDYKCWLSLSIKTFDWTEVDRDACGGH